METETKTAAPAPTVNKNKRFFDLEAGAKILAELAPEDAIDRELEVVKVVAAKDSTYAERAIHLLRGVTTQGSFAAIIVNLTHGEGQTISGELMTAALQLAFPNAGVGDRHGPHYLCHARTAIKSLTKDANADNQSVKTMKGLRTGMAPLPTARRKAKAKDVEVAEPEKLTAELLMKENDIETLRSMAESMGIKVGKKAKVESIADRIVKAMEKTVEPEVAVVEKKAVAA